MTSEDQQINLRVPDGMRDRLKSIAAGNKRSLNSEIIARLEASFEAGLSGEIATLIQKHIDAEVQRRLREIAAKIGGA